MEEWTEPADGRKEMFFRNLFCSVLEEKPRFLLGWGRVGEWIWGWWMWVRVMVVMWELDNYPVVVDCGGGRGEWRGVRGEGD